MPTLHIYRYDPDTDAKPRMQVLQIDADPADRMLLDAWTLDSEILIDASLGITEVNATTTGEPAYYAPLRPIPAQAMATHSAWTAPAPLALASLHPWASTERVCPDSMCPAMPPSCSVGVTTRSRGASSGSLAMASMMRW